MTLLRPESHLRNLSTVEVLILFLDRCERFSTVLYRYFLETSIDANLERINEEREAYNNITLLLMVLLTFLRWPLSRAIM